MISSPKKRKLEEGQETSDSMTIELPTELWQRIFHELTISDLQRLHASNRFFFNMIRADSFWINMYRCHFQPKAVPSVRERCLLAYNSPDWEAPCEELTPILRNLNRSFTRYRCNPPTLEELATIISYDEMGAPDDEAIADRSDELNCISDNINFDAVLFFARNHPDLLECVAFSKYALWNGNDLVLIMLTALDRKRVVNNIDQHKQETLLNITHELLAQYGGKIARHLMETRYVLDTTDRSESFSSSGFRRLVYEGAYTALRLLFQRFGPTPFEREFTRIDEIQYCILSEITAACENRGKRDVLTLQVLLDFCGPQLRRLAQMHLREPSHPNAFFCISQTTNTAFIRRFLEFFREEGKVFVNHFQNHVQRHDYEFQQVFAFAKTWCCD